MIINTVYLSICLVGYSILYNCITFAWKMLNKSINETPIVFKNLSNVNVVVVAVTFYRLYLKM